MSYFEPPNVDRRDDEGVAVWRLVGDWTRDLPVDVRHQATSALRDQVQRLVLDLRDLKFIDSWGEETVCDVLQRVGEEGGAVAWTRDAARPAEFAGVQRALERRQLAIDSFTDLAAAITAVKQS